MPDDDDDSVAALVAKAERSYAQVSPDRVGATMSLDPDPKLV